MAGISVNVNRTINLIILLSMALVMISCHIGRYFYWNYADINDYKKFPSAEIKKEKSRYEFNKSPENIKISLPEKFKEKKINTLKTFLEKNKTVSFMIIRNDTIIYENYFNGYNRQNILPAFSIAKSFVSSLIAIAVDEGYIKSIDQPVTDYITNFKNPGFSRITLLHLLNMESGIKFNEGYSNPFGEMAKFYYGKNLKKYVLNLKTEKEPGTEYEYQSGNTQILAMVLEKATGKTLAEYLEEKIWKELPMNYNASWNYDSKKHKNIKAFCCINARITDFAIFGKLILNNGKWEEKQIIPAQWFIDIKNTKPKYTDDTGYPYYMHWRVVDKGTLFAKGILGQYIYIDTSKNLIILRFGKKAGDVDWPELFESISGKL